MATCCQGLCCGQHSRCATPPRSILVRPDALENFANALGVARIPASLAPTKPGTEHREAFSPLVPRTNLIGAEAGGRLDVHWTPVFLHVYDTEVVNINSDLIKSISGLPIYHVGVEVNHQEFCFSSDGILCGLPGKFDPMRHRLAVPVGGTALTNREILGLLQGLHRTFRAEEYRLIGFNCQTFALEFLETLGVKPDRVPHEYRRFAHGLMPPGWTATRRDTDDTLVADCYLPEGGSPAGRTRKPSVCAGPPSRIRL